MSRLFLMLATVLLTGPVFAQSPPVIVKSELAAESVTVGQPLVLRVTVLVPTWMLEPPRFPSMEIPNVIVRLPSRASSPVSERIDGETWSGVSRAYRLYPMIPGTFSLLPQPLAVTYAAPETRAPTQAEVALERVMFSAVIPDAAKTLDPLILAEEFSLGQTFEGDESPLGQGGSVTRIVSSKIEGTSALFIPPLIAQVSEDAARAYAKDPVVAENEARGVLSGSREETVSYVAQYGGTLELPEISLDWYNTTTKQIETATLEGRTYQIDAPLPPRDPLLTRRQIVTGIGVLFVLGLGALVVGRYVLPPLRSRRRQRRATWLASEAYAARQVKRAIGGHDLSNVYTALATWSPRCSGTPGPELEAALALVGQARFRNGETSSRNWSTLSTAFQNDRDRRMTANATSSLPPLNKA